MPKAGVTHDIILTIGGVEYGIMLADMRGSYQELDINPVSPKIGGSGPTKYSDLSFWSVHAQDDWSHGLGHKEFKDPQGYHRSSGSIDTRHKGVVQLATKIVASDEDLPAQAYQMVDFGGDVYACYDGTATGLELLSNTGFETAGAGGSDVFANWIETTGGGNSAIEDETTIVDAGSHACKATGNGSEGSTHAAQIIAVSAGERYKLTFKTRGASGQAAAEQGDYGVWDNTNGAWITSWTPTGVPGDSETYTTVTHSFTVPSTCTDVKIHLAAPSEDNKIAYYDTTSVKRTSGGIRKFTTSSGTWGLVTDPDVIDSDVYCLLDNGAYLFAGVDEAQALKSADGAAFSTAGQASATDFRFMALGGGKMWAAKDGDNHVHWASSIDGSDWEGDENDTNRITVGPGQVPITGLAWFNAGLHVTREDGLWVIPESDPTVAYRLLNWSNERRSSNGAGMIVWRDKLIIPKGPELLAFTGTGISDITPPAIGLSFPYTQYGNFEALATFGPYLYVAAQEGAVPIVSETLRPNAVGSTTELTIGGTNPAPTNWESVDEETLDYTTTFVRNHSKATWTDTYNLSPSSLSSETIKRITLHAAVQYSQWLGTTQTTFYGVLRPTSTNRVHDTSYTYSVSTAWHILSWEWTTNPDDESPWVVADLDSLQAGVRITQTDGDDNSYVSQVWVEVEYEGKVPYRLLCYDGAAWHSVGSLDAGGKSLYLSAESDRLWVNDYDADATNYNTKEVRVQEHSFLPYDEYPTTGTHSLHPSRIHCELERVEKCFHSLWIKSNNLTAARYIAVYYRTSGKSWVSLGNITQSPWQKISLSNILGKYIDLRFDLVTDSASESPILEANALEFLARPDTIYGFSTRIEVGDDVVGLDGKTNKKYSARDLHAALKQARNSQVPIGLTDVFGDSYDVLVTAYRVLDVRRRGKHFDATALLNLGVAD